jgi:hypothetical protein
MDEGKGDISPADSTAVARLTPVFAGRDVTAPPHENKIKLKKKANAQLRSLSLVMPSPHC